jgi:MFS family permease
LSLLQASSGIGNIAAALIYLSMGQLEHAGSFNKDGFFGAMGLTPWRVCFLVGTLPALLVLLIRRRLKEPAIWAEQSENKERGSYVALFSNPVWRRHALFGLLLGFSAVVGLWGIGFFTAQLLKDVFRRGFMEAGLAGDELAGKLKTWAGLTSVMQNLGGMAGIICGGLLAQRVGRRPAFAVSYLSAGISTGAVFWFLDRPSQIFWLVPIMGFCQLSIFGLLAVYLPELFPTRLRSTGTSFCYNVGRFLAAAGPFVFGILTTSVFVGFAYEPARYAGVTMCSVFALGLIALPFLPETKDKPLPE